VTAVPATRRVVRLDAFGGTEQLVVRSEPMPVPGPGEVLVAIGAAGVNFADTMVRRGEYRKDQTVPHVPGMEAAGVVVGSGPGAQLAEGTPVALFLEQGGGYADHAVVPESLAFAIDVPLPSAQVAGAFLQGVTAWYAVHRYGLVARGDAVLVPGATGGLGGWTVQLALEAGATVTALASTPDKRAAALDQGSVAAFDPSDPDLTSRLREVASRGFDVIVDGVGGPLFGRILPALARGGRYVVAGSATQAPAMLDVRHLLPRGQTVTGFVVRNVIDLDPREPALALSEVLGRLADGRVSMPVTVLPLSDAARAHELIESRSVVGKLVLDPSR
jgi:NADPH2:quinone reductase